MVALAASGQKKNTRNSVGFSLPGNGGGKLLESNRPCLESTTSVPFPSEQHRQEEPISADLAPSRYDPKANRKTSFLAVALIHGLIATALLAGFGSDLTQGRVEGPDRLTVVELKPIPAPPPAASAETQEARMAAPPDRIPSIAGVSALTPQLNLVPPAPSPPAGNPVPTSTPASPAEERAPTSPVADAPSVPDPTELKQQQSRYAGMLMAHLARHKRYPRELRDAGIQGRGLVLFNLTADGRIASLKLVRSTGSPELDRQVRAIFERAQPFPIPDWSRDVFQTSYTLPVDFTITS